MEMEKGQYFIYNGQLRLMSDENGIEALTAGTLRVDEKSLHYGTLIFEGERANMDANGNLHLFWESAHRERMGYGIRFYDMGDGSLFEYGKDGSKLGMDGILAQTLDLINLNFPGRDKVYVRRAIGRGPGLGVNPKGAQVDYMLITEIWPEYVTSNAMFVSQFARPMAPQPLVAFDPRLKLSANYGYSSKAKYEAQSIAVDPPAVEPIMLNSQFRVAEASGANIFIVNGNELSTPAACEGALEGITRRAILQSGRHGTYQRQIELAELLMADGVFLTGSATNVKEIKVVYAEDGFARQLVDMGKLGSALYDNAARGKFGAKIKYRYSEKQISLLRFGIGKDGATPAVRDISLWYEGVIYNRNREFSHLLTKVEPTLSKWAKSGRKLAWEMAGLKPPAGFMDGRGVHQGRKKIRA